MALILNFFGAWKSLWRRGKEKRGKKRRWYICTKKSKKILAKIRKKLLLFFVGYGIIMERDCTRYAMKREVAAETGRFFRGVCQISNRAKEYLTRKSTKKLEVCQQGCFADIGGLCVSDAKNATRILPCHKEQNPVLKCEGWKHPGKCELLSAARQIF